MKLTSTQVVKVICITLILIAGVIILEDVIVNGSEL